MYTWLNCFGSREKCMFILMHAFCNERRTNRSTIHYRHRSMAYLATSLKTIRKGEQKTAMKIIQGNMSDSSIFGSTITKCVLSL